MTGNGTPDQIQQIWFLKWAQYALLHGHNPFYTPWQNYPVGLNLLGNTSMLILGVTFSPITTLFGPIVTWNLLLRLAVVASSTSMCLVLRRWTTWWPASFIGGLLYGFSAYATFYSGGYLFLAFVPLPPLMFLLLHEVVVRQRRSAARTGAALGLVCGIQFFISAEVLTSTVVMAAIACAIFFFMHRRSLRTKWPYLKRAFLSSLCVGGLLLAYPVIFMLLGTAHVRGVPQLAGVQSDLLGTFVPGFYLWAAPMWAKDLWTQFASYFYSLSLYLGIPLIVALVWIVVWLRKRQIVLFAGAMIVISFILSLGSNLQIDLHDTGIPLPFIFLAHVPIFDGLVATRFSLFTNLFGAGVLAMGVDEGYRRLKQPGRLEWLPRDWRVVGAGAVSLSIAAIVAIPLLPSHTHPTSSTRVATLFTSDSISQVPTGSVVLAYPYPSTPVKTLYGRSTLSYPFVETIDNAQLGQLESGMRFKLIGGYGWTPSNAVMGIANPSPLIPASVEAFFNVSFYGVATPAQRRTLSHTNLDADLRLFMRKYHVDTVIVLPLGQHPAVVVSHITAAIGGPSRSGGATTWFHVQQRIATTSNPPELTR